jgi:alkanesulfonate monooxygenase SsuD/methylene tetrahydromethanopterin reductase-like flavin-dependent oxidoreductase (luciferase family)
VISEDPQKIEQTVQALAQLRKVSPEEARAMSLVGTPEEIKKQVQAYIEAGVTHIILGQRQPYDREGLQRFAKEVMPAFR